MAIGSWNVEFLNLNSQRNYPLADVATGLDTSGEFEIPDDFIVGMDIPIHAGLNVDPARFFIRNIGAYATGYSVIVGYQPSVGSAVNVATALISRDAHTLNTTYAMGGIGDYDDTVGKIVIGSLDNIDNQPAGFHSFDIDGTRLEADIIRPMLQNVSSIRVSAGGETSNRLTGDVELVAGRNIKLVPADVSGSSPEITISAIEGEGTVEDCVCVGSNEAVAIKRINGISPDADGNFTLVGSDCLRLEPISNGLKLNDVCSQPCCGCEELETLTQELERFGAASTTLQNFLNRLESNVTQMSSTVLGSRLNDQGCPSD